MRATVQFDIEVPKKSCGLPNHADHIAWYYESTLQDSCGLFAKHGPVRVSIEAEDDPVHFERGETHVLLDEPSPNAGAVTIVAVDRNVGTLKVANNSRAYEFEMALPKDTTHEALGMVLADAFFERGLLYGSEDAWITVRVGRRPFQPLSDPEREELRKAWEVLGRSTCSGKVP